MLILFAGNLLKLTNNKMKTIIKTLSIFIIIFFIHSCSNDTVVSPPPVSGPFILSGNIENWTLGSGIKLRAELYDSNYVLPLILDSNIISNGAFSLKFNTPPDSFLYPIIFYSDTSCVNNVTINPSNTKSSNSVGLDLFNDSVQIGYIYRSNYVMDTIPIVGQFFTYYLYLNQNVSITGSLICNNVYYHDTIIYNVSGTKGWNKMVVLYNSYSNNSMKVTVSSNEPAGGKWYVHAWMSNAASNKSLFRQRIFNFNNCFCK